MHSEKLKQLVKDKVPLKFRIKNEQQSKELQKFLFALDVYWPGENGFYSGNMSFNYICVRYYNSKYSILKICGDETDFKNSNPKEFSIDDDCLIEECKWPNLKKLVEEKVPLKFRVRDKHQFREMKDFFLTFGIDFEYSFGGTYAPYFVSKCTGFFNKYETFCYDDYPTYCSIKAKEFDFENDRLVEENESKIICKKQIVTINGETVEFIQINFLIRKELMNREIILK